MPKKILLLTRKDTEHPKAGGAEKVIQKYAKGLAETGYCVTRIAPLFSGAPKEEYKDGIHIKRMLSLHTIYFCFPIWHLFCNKQKYDLIIDHAGGIPLLSPLYIWKTPIFFFVHHIGTTEREDYFQPFGYMGKLFRRVYTYFVLHLYRKKTTITVSQATAQELYKLGFTDVHVFPNTTDYPHIQTPTPKIKLVLTSVGRIVPNKQFSHAIHILKTLHNKGLRYHLHIVGAAQDQCEYKRLLLLIKENKLTEFVTFHGKLSEKDLIALWDQTRYGLLLSDKEGFGLTTLEANTRGVPMIGYNVPGVNEVIQHGKNGRLLEKNNRNQGVQYIISSSEEEYMQLVKTTLNFINNYPTWKSNQQHCIELVHSQEAQG